MDDEGSEKNGDARLDDGMPGSHLVAPQEESVLMAHPSTPKTNKLEADLGMANQVFLKTLLQKLKKNTSTVQLGPKPLKTYY